MQYENTQLGTNAIVKVRMFNTSSEALSQQLTQWTVNLGGIPSNNNKGMEVTVNFFSFDIKNNKQTFYTDSNSLEMQKRVLN